MENKNLIRKYGYARVSSRDQNLARQIAALQQAGLTPQEIYADKQSGADFNRKEYKKLIKKLKKGDLLYIKSIDRLGRNYEEIIEQWRIITKEKGADIIVLDFPLLNTAHHVEGNNLTGRFLADLTLQVLSYVAQMERENIKQRQAEGIRMAKEQGVRFGRPRIQVPEGFERVYWLWKEEKISKGEAARRLDTGRTTLTRWIQRYEMENQALIKTEKTYD